MRHSHNLTLGAAAASLFAVGACQANPDPTQATIGSVEVALESTGSAGARYRLGGTFTMNDPESTTVSVDQFDGSPSVILAPRVGSYQLELCSASSANAACAAAAPWGLWQIRCVDSLDVEVAASLCQGSTAGFTEQATPVAGAVLSSVNPQAANVLLNQSTQVVFQFFVPGEGTVSFARGNVDIDIAVGEGFPDGAPCTSDIECASDVCAISGTVQSCQVPTCSDGVQNGGEPGPDCGGPCTASCFGSDAGTTTTTDPSDPTSGGTTTDPTSGGTTTDPSAGTTACAFDSECPAPSTCLASGVCG